MNSPTKTKEMLLVEKRFGEPLETLLPRLFNEHDTLQKVAETISISRNALYHWCRSLGITTQRVITVVDAP